MKVISEKYTKGMKKLKAIGQSAERAIESLSSVSPDLAKYTIEFTCGEIYSRPGLDIKVREMIAIAALTVLGNTLPQLKLHVEGAINNGCSKEEITEIIMQMAIYAGFPVVFNAIYAADEVFKKLNIQE
jgi:4-carboxymuconolactone decarboxylase